MNTRINVNSDPHSEPRGGGNAPTVNNPQRRRRTHWSVLFSQTLTLNSRLFTENI